MREQLISISCTNFKLNVPAPARDQDTSNHHHRPFNESIRSSPARTDGNFCDSTKKCYSLQSRYVKRVRDKEKHLLTSCSKASLRWKTHFVTFCPPLHGKCILLFSFDWKILLHPFGGIEKLASRHWNNFPSSSHFKACLPYFLKCNCFLERI